MDNIFNISLITYTILSFVGGYLIAYLQQKAKNRALKEDLNTLEREKQSIISEYNTKLEVIKKEHALEIEKRKYKYEDKRKQFSRYFELIDNFSALGNDLFMNEFMPAVNKLMSTFISEENETEHNKALVEFSENIGVMTSKLYEEQIRIETETNSLRLIANSEIELLLNDLKISMDDVANTTTEFFKDFSSLYKQPNKLDEINHIIQQKGKEVEKLKRNLIELMRRELDTI